MNSVLPVGIYASITEDRIAVTQTTTTQLAINITSPATEVGISAIPALTNASDIGVTAYNTITGTDLQTAIEQLADQYWVQSATPSGDNLAEGDLWYDTANEELKVYRETSTSGVFQWRALQGGGFVTGSESNMDALDGGSF